VLLASAPFWSPAIAYRWLLDTLAGGIVVIDAHPASVKPPGTVAPGVVVSLLERFRLGHLKVRSGQFAALAHNIISELLPLVESVHSGTLDRGNMDKYVRPSIVRLNKAKTFVN
jgi:hypothetical protein